MAQYNFDLSDYQQSEHAQYISRWSGCDDLSPSFFGNSVSYSQEEKKLHINIAPTYEFEAMFGVYDELEYPIPEAYQIEPSDEEVERWRNDLQKIREKFGASFEVQPPEPLYPYDASEHKINAFSGTAISAPLGEGLLNFCYADFNSAFEVCTPMYQKLAQRVEAPEKIQSAEEGLIHLYELYAEVFPALSEVFYSSVYTASFPPQFTRHTEKALEYYRQYLSLLQAEFLELLEFCLDKEYRPGVLSRLYPSERYSLWCRIKGVLATHTRLETFHPASYEPHSTKMPFGIDPEELDRDISDEIVLSQEQRAFAKEHGLSERELQLRYEIPCFISTSYACDNLRDMLYLEFSKILEAGVEFQKCKRCGRYFIVKGNYHGTYCDRIAEGESRTCQQLAAQEAYLNKLKDNGGKNALNIYQKYYKRYFARVTAGSLKQEKFKRWQYEAVQKRDDCLKGTITLQELTDWLEGSMPNRAKKV